MSSNRSNQGQWRLADERKQTLEDYPQVNTLKCKRIVAFSQYSEVRLVNNNSYGFKKSYSSNDFDMFRAQLSLEASSLQDILSRLNLPTGKAINSALSLGLIKPEELVGLEHLASADAKRENSEEQKTHVSLVLRAQKLLREKRKDSDEVASFMLATVASKSSSGSAKKAMIRGLMSSRAENCNPDSNIKSRKVMNNCQKELQGLSPTGKFFKSKNDDCVKKKDTYSKEC